MMMIMIMMMIMMIFSITSCVANRIFSVISVKAMDEYEVHGDGFSACPPFKSYSDWLGKLKLLQFKPEQMIAVYALTGISVLSLIFVLAAYVFVPELRTLPGKMTASLVACLLAGHILLNVPWPSDTSRARDMACRLIGCVSHFSWLSVFVWMSALAFHMARTFYSPAANQMSRNEADKAFRKYSRLCWGLPVVFVLVCFALDSTPGHGLTTDYGKDMCGWMGPRAVMFVFLIPAALSLALNFACIAAAVVGIEKTAQASSMAGSRRSECQRLVIYAKMACALGLPWLLGLGVSFTDWEWLWWTYAAVNSLQGTFIAWAFVVNQRLVRTLKRKFGRQAETSDTKTSSAWSTVSKPVALSEIPANKL
nr:hypothetical protein BaRGS_014956 [Batillaria attramentaria]